MGAFVVVNLPTATSRRGTRPLLWAQALSERRGGVDGDRRAVDFIKGEEEVEEVEMGVGVDFHVSGISSPLVLCISLSLSLSGRALPRARAHTPPKK